MHHCRNQKCVGCTSWGIDNCFHPLHRSFAPYPRCCLSRIATSSLCSFPLCRVHPPFNITVESEGKFGIPKMSSNPGWQTCHAVSFVFQLKKDGFCYVMACVLSLWGGGMRFVMFDMFQVGFKPPFPTTLIRTIHEGQAIVLKKNILSIFVQDFCVYTRIRANLWS